MLIKHPPAHHIYSKFKYVPTPLIEKCSICYIDMKYKVSLDCKHKFCEDCIFTWVNTQLEEGKSTVRCMDPDCEKKILPANISSYHLAKKLENRMVQYSLSSNNNSLICSCCNSIIESRPCFFLKCIPSYLLCTQCKNHKKSIRINEQLSYQYKKNCKPCPCCRILIDKDEGCKHMTCVCGHSFCWNCECKWVYKHIC